MAAADPNEPLAVLEPRALRQFTDPDYQGPKIYLAPKAFEDKVGNQCECVWCGERTAELESGAGSFACPYTHTHRYM